MFHACVQRFNVMSIVENFLGTKRGLRTCVPFWVVSEYIERDVFRYNPKRLIREHFPREEFMNREQPW